jgi:hypothetical protein
MWPWSGRRRRIPPGTSTTSRGWCLGWTSSPRSSLTSRAATSGWARDLLGYGTVRGLAVDIEGDEGKTSDSLQKWKVTVTGGAALDPCGRLICVPRAQCGYLNDWLKDHADAVRKKVTEEGSLDLYLTLSYDDCPTDSVPIPGEPCRSDDELKAPSRDCRRLPARAERRSADPDGRRVAQEVHGLARRGARRCRYRCHARRLRRNGESLGTRGSGTGTGAAHQRLAARRAAHLGDRTASGGLWPKLRLCDHDHLVSRRACAAGKDCADRRAAERATLASQGPCRSWTRARAQF